MIKAMAYGRTSSLTNVGEGKDSRARQSVAIQAYAEQSGYHIVRPYFDEGVSGSTRVLDRPQFKAMLDAMAEQGVKIILIESPDRFARDLIVQIVGYDMLTDLGIKLIPASAPTFFQEETPTGVFIRNVMGAVAEFEKSSLVNRLKAARERKTASGERGVGRESLAEKLSEGVLRDIMDHRAQGHSYQYIADIFSTEDRKFSLHQIRNVVKWVERNGFPRNRSDENPIGYDQIN